MRTQFVEKYSPLDLDGFAGLDRPIRMMRNLVKNPFDSAWMFLGAPGLGKTRLAHVVANMIGGEIHHLPSKSCDLEAVERVMHLCRYVPWSGQYHFVIVDEADQMSRASQLYFLSKLDGTDSPKQTMFFFTANETTLLENRFLSRCRLLEWPASSKMHDAAVEVLSKVWQAEGRSLKRAPDFGELFIRCGRDIRQSLNELELELIAPSEDHKVEAISIDYSSLSQLYSLGAEKLEPSEVRSICTLLGITVVIDVMQKHFRRRVDHQRAVESGGVKFMTRPGCNTFPVESKELDWLKKLMSTQKVLLLGGPESPGDCRRHVQIAVPMLKRGVDCVHVYVDELVKASDLQTSIINRVEEYEYIPFELGKKVA